MIPDRRQFILANTRLQPVPHTPEIRLHLADEATALWERTEEELGKIGLPPPYWAFAWAGGQALARYLLDHPNVVNGKRVLDFASGSGLVAIAAAKSGASGVVASDIDDFSLAAIALNATANNVTVATTGADLIGGQQSGYSVVLAGDVCYERPMAERVESWLRDLHQEGATVLLGDPGRTYLPKAGLRKLAEYTVATTRALEDALIKRTSVWTLE